MSVAYASNFKIRHYSPETGRFLSEDPIGFASGDSSLYIYSKNNPLVYIDPYGTFSMRCILYNLGKMTSGLGRGAFYGVLTVTSAAGGVTIIVATFPLAFAGDLGITAINIATGQNYDMFFFDKVWEDFGNNIIGYVIDKPTRNMLLKFKEASDAASDLGGCVSGSGDGC